MPKAVTHPSRESLVAAIQARELRQSDIALALGASQSQVSRVLSGESGARSRLYGRVCDYVFSQQRSVKRKDVQQCAELLDALAEIWDGTHDQARTLATIIRSLTPLTRSR